MALALMLWAIFNFSIVMGAAGNARRSGYCAGYGERLYCWLMRRLRRGRFFALRWIREALRVSRGLVRAFRQDAPGRPFTRARKGAARFCET